MSVDECLSTNRQSLDDGAAQTITVGGLDLTGLVVATKGTI
jgi:hypothetical protein